MRGFTVYDEKRKNTPIKGVLFDMDGTVLDTEKLYTRFAVQAARSLGYPMTMEHALALRSSSTALGQKIMEGFFGPQIDYRQIRSIRVRLTEDHIEKYGIDVKPGILELLDFLQSQGIPAAIATAAPMERAERYLEQTGLLGRFSKIVCTRDVVHGKPAPDVYLYAAQQLGVEPGACIAVEDSPRGAESAFRAGSLSVMVPDLDQPDEKTKEFLYAKAERLDGIIDLIRWMKED